MRVVLGVGGGIAAYKSAELVRALQERGCTIQVVMTAGAEQFIRPLTFAALTGRKVITSLFDTSSPEGIEASSIEHIRVAQEHDVLAVAPLTANLAAEFAHGFAPDFLTTMYLAFAGPVVLAPAMNTNMWQHPATVHNFELLRKRGHVIVEPEAGPLACGMVRPGRLAAPEKIAKAIIEAATVRDDLTGETVLITAGPTQEPLDPVRYVTNRSSGKMGYALAEAAVKRGARVLLVSGPVSVPEVQGAETIHVRTAREMRDAVMSKLEESTVIIKSAAVADYHLAQVPAQKVKKTSARLSLELDPTPDILAEVGQKRGDRLLIGFAAETRDLVEEARRKLETKHCDMIVANLVGPGLGFEADVNEVTLVTRTGETLPLPKASKREIADRIFDQALKLRLALHAVQ